MTESKCRAKNPDSCWKHGNKQGQVAYEKIKQVVVKSPEKYYLSKEQRKTTPLKEMTPVGLTLTLLDTCEDNPNINLERVKNAILMASDLHQNDLRSTRGKYDRTAYIEHPLRNAIRSIRYGIESETIIIGSLFHDLVEDHPFEMSEKYYGVKAKTEEEARENCYRYLRITYGNRIAKMVEGMSNPIVDRYTPAEEKNKGYAEHVKEAIKDPAVCIGKSCDFVDNAVGLIHNVNGTMNKAGIVKRAKKYLPVCDIIENHLKDPEVRKSLKVPDDGLERMIEHIQDGRRSLTKIIKTLS